MTNREIYEIARRQSAVDMNCDAGDFLKNENRIVYSAEREGSRRYLKLPFDCNLVSYGTNIVASVKPQVEEIVKSYLSTYPLEHCFETPNMHVLNDALVEKGLRVCFMAEYFLPDTEYLRPLDCGFELRLLSQEDFRDLYVPEWGNALCDTRREWDVLGVGAFDGERLAGLAACSADCETMWQIGVDVRPEYRRRGIAASLTSRLAAEILDRGKVPFYCAAWSNLRSVRNAVKCGFRPAWVEMTAKSVEFVNEMNQTPEKGGSRQEGDPAGFEYEKKFL